MTSDEATAFVLEIIGTSFPCVDSRGRSLIGPEVIGSYQRVLAPFTPAQARRGVESLLDTAERPWTRPPTARMVAEAAVRITGPGRDRHFARPTASGAAGHRGPWRHCCVCGSAKILQPFVLPCGETFAMCVACYQAIRSGALPEPRWGDMPVDMPIEADEPATVPDELDAVL
jgi:hypothetical protein